MAVVVKFLDELFEKNESYVTGAQEPSKILISSMTNVAVDGILKRCVLFSFCSVLLPKNHIVIFTTIHSTGIFFFSNDTAITAEVPTKTESYLQPSVCSVV